MELKNSINDLVDGVKEHNIKYLVDKVKDHIKDLVDGVKEQCLVYLVSILVR